MARTGKTRTRAPILVGGHEINPRTRREPMAFKPNYRRDRAEHRGQHAHAPRKNKAKRRRLRCAKPSARQPQPRRMTNDRTALRLLVETRSPLRREWSRDRAFISPNPRQETNCTP